MIAPRIKRIENIHATIIVRIPSHAVGSAFQFSTIKYRRKSTVIPEAKTLPFNHIDQIDQLTVAVKTKIRRKIKAKNAEVKFMDFALKPKIRNNNREKRDSISPPNLNDPIPPPTSLRFYTFLPLQNPHRNI
jgi:hypothetical protein